VASYSLDPISANCYPDTSVLINKFGIRDADALDKAEAEITQARALLWGSAPLADTFDFEHYKTIHRYLFGELYDWAGTVRKVNISKKGTRFCPFNEIGERAEQIFIRLQKLNFFRKLNAEKFLNEFTDFYISTNELHPFRDGNGRTQRLFLSQLAYLNGYSLDFSVVDTDLLMIATIQSAQGVTDLLRSILAVATQYGAGEAEISAD
jgi:cell filamentation protein